MRKTYRIEVDCANCADKMEKAANEVAGVKEATVSFMTLKMKVEFEEGADFVTVMEEVRRQCKRVEDECEVYLTLRKVRLLGLIPREEPKQGYYVDITAGRETEGYSVIKTANVSNLEYRWPVIRDDVVYNLGYGHAGRNLITLEFGKDAELSLADIDVTAVPMSSYLENAKSLRESVLESSEVGADRVVGKISVPEERILQFAIPYSDGWSATVDGKKAELFRSDVMYFSTLISPGEHDVELRYETPWLKTGVIISAAALVLWIGYEVLMRRHNREKV